MELANHCVDKGYHDIAQCTENVEQFWARRHFIPLRCIFAQCFSMIDFNDWKEVPSINNHTIMPMYVIELIKE